MNFVLPGVGWSISTFRLSFYTPPSHAIAGEVKTGNSIADRIQAIPVSVIAGHVWNVAVTGYIAVARLPETVCRSMLSVDIAATPEPSAQHVEAMTHAVSSHGPEAQC